MPTPLMTPPATTAMPSKRAAELRLAAVIQSPVEKLSAKARRAPWPRAAGCK